MKITKLLSIMLSLVLLWSMSCTKGCQKKEAETQKTLGVFFENLKNNDEVTSPLTVKFGVTGMTVRAALEDVNDRTSGHHHILIDHPVGFIETGLAVPADPRHIHYGKGETSAILELPPGVHTLSLQFADGAHLSYGPDLSATITVRVAEPGTAKEEAPPSPPKAPTEGEL